MSLRLVPAGSTIERVYYAVPEHYTVGSEYEDFISAREAAIDRYFSVYHQTLAGYEFTVVAGVKDGVPVTKESIAHETAAVKAVVDLRWVIKEPKGQGHLGVTTDTMIERINVAHMAKARMEKVDA